MISFIASKDIINKMAIRQNFNQELFAPYSNYYQYLAPNSKICQHYLVPQVWSRPDDRHFDIFHEFKKEKILRMLKNEIIEVHLKSFAPFQFFPVLRLKRYEVSGDVKCKIKCNGFNVHMIFLFLIASLRLLEFLIALGYPFFATFSVLHIFEH